MGLAIGVGTLASLLTLDAEGADWTRRSLARLDEVLARHGLPLAPHPAAGGPRRAGRAPRGRAPGRQRSRGAALGWVAIHSATRARHGSSPRSA